MSNVDGRRRPKRHSPVCTRCNGGRCPDGLWSQASLINDDKGEWHKVATFSRVASAKGAALGADVANAQATNAPGFVLVNCGWIQTHFGTGNSYARRTPRNVPQTGEYWAVTPLTADTAVARGNSVGNRSCEVAVPASDAPGERPNDLIAYCIETFTW